MDSSEKGFEIDGDAQRLKSLRSEAGLQGTVKVMLGSDKSAEIVNDRVVTGGISRPMATDGKGEEDSPSERRNENSRRRTSEIVPAGANDGYSRRRTKDFVPAGADENSRRRSTEFEPAGANENSRRRSTGFVPE